MLQPSLFILSTFTFICLISAVISSLAVTFGSAANCSAENLFVFLKLLLNPVESSVIDVYVQ